MDLVVLLLRACGAFNLVIGVFHLVSLPQLMRWDRLARLDPINAKLMRLYNCMLTYVFCVYGATLTYMATQQNKADGSTNAGAAPWFLLAGAGFWLLRTALHPALLSMQYPGVVTLYLSGLSAVGHAAAAYLLWQ